MQSYMFIVAPLKCARRTAAGDSLLRCACSVRAKGTERGQHGGDFLIARLPCNPAMPSEMGGCDSVDVSLVDGWT